MLYTFVIIPMRATCLAHLIFFWFDSLSDIWRRVQIMKLLILQFSSAFCHFIPRGSKYSPQYPVLRNNLVFFRYCKRPSFTPIQNRKQNYSCAYFNLYVFTQQTEKQMIFNYMVTSMPRI
jgi:hypothetical protein